jgi:hypothetical protein
MKCVGPAVVSDDDARVSHRPRGDTFVCSHVSARTGRRRVVNVCGL